MELQNRTLLVYICENRFCHMKKSFLVKPPIAGRPKAALLVWFFGDFRCAVLLFMVILVIYEYKNR